MEVVILDYRTRLTRPLLTKHLEKVISVNIF